MAYIGNTNTTQAFTPAVDFFSGNGSTTAFTLSRPVASVAQVQVAIENVPQNPGDAFTVSGNTITFTSAPPSGTNNIYVYYTSPITQVIAPGQGTVGTTALVDGAVTTAKIAAGAVIPADLSTGAPYWDTSGNVGIGTSSPGAKLDVVGNIKLNGYSVYSGTAATSANMFAGTAFNTGGAAVVFRGISSGYNNGGIEFYTGSGATGSEVVRIDSSGYVAIGTTSTGSNSALLTVAGTVSASFTGRMYSLGTYNNTTGSAANMHIASDGHFFRSTSSLKYKTDVQDATHGLSEVMALRPVTYKGKTDGDLVFGGLIAEEVHEAGLTEFVQYAEDGSPDALAYGNMVSLCIKAIQEQQAIITTLTERITALENK